MKLKKNLFLLVAGGYILSLVFYLIWYYAIPYFSPYGNNITGGPKIKIVVVVITALYFFLYFLISSVRSFQKPWKSFFLVSITTLLIFGLIPSVYYVGYEFIKAKSKIAMEKMQMKSLKAQINVASKSIEELTAKLEYERKENENLRDQLNETIKKTESNEVGYDAKDDIIKQKKPNKILSIRTTDSETGNSYLDTKNQEIHFKVQIISSNTRLPTNSPQFKDLKNVWEYKDNGLYKYTVGTQRDLKSASVLQSELRRKGFVGAFVVAFKNGKRIPVGEALKFLN